MQPATVSVRIQRPHGVVHEMLLDLDGHAEFLDHLVTAWTPTSDGSRGVGASATMRWKDHSRHGEIAIEVTEVAPGRIVEVTRGGRGMRRRMRVTYAIEPVADAATQVTTTLELLEGSALDLAADAHPPRARLRAGDAAPQGNARGRDRPLSRDAAGSTHSWDGPDDPARGASSWGRARAAAICEVGHPGARKPRRLGRCPVRRVWRRRSRMVVENADSTTIAADRRTVRVARS